MSSATRRIVYLTERHPGAPGGTPERMRGQIRALQRHGSVEVVVLSSSAKADESLPNVAASTTVLARRGVSALTRAAGLVCALTGVRPSKLDFIRTAANRRAVAPLVRSADLVWTFDLLALLSLDPSAADRPPVIADLCDFVATREETIASERSTVLRAMARLNARAYRRLYKHAGRKALVLVAASEADAQAMGAGADVLPNTYELALRTKLARSAASDPVFVFVGSLNYFPNADAVDWLVSDIWPAVRAALPNARLRIVGAGYKGRVPDEADGVTMLGFVEDVAPELTGAIAAIIPLRYGSGTRIKVLEAWANGLPVISSAIGVEGLNAVHGVDALIADTVHGIRDAAFAVAHDPALAGNLAAAGRKHWEEEYSPERLQRSVDHLVARALAADAPTFSRAAGGRRA